MGTEVIVGLIMAIVGAATQMYASNQANKKAQARMNEGYMQLRESQDKINEQIAKATGEYETSKREATQAEEADRIASDIKADVAESQAIRDQQQTTAGNVSSDYEKARADAQQKTADEVNAFADLLGRIRSAGMLRMKEGWGTARIGQEISRLGRDAQGNMTVAQDEANQALHSYDGLANFGKLLGAAGTVISLGAGAAGSGAGTAGAAASSDVAAGAANSIGMQPALNLSSASQAALAANSAKLPWIGTSALSLGALAGSNPWRTN